MDHKSCLEKQKNILDIFTSCPTKEEKYLKIIELGKKQITLNQDERVPENIVKGCQSVMYLASSLEGGKVHFKFESESLISAGLAAILVAVYSDESPETILTCPPSYLEPLDLQGSLTPGRSNGLYSIHLRMKQDALKLLMKK